MFGSCNKSYIGETGSGLDTRLKEHKRDVRNHNRQNALVLHLEKCQNLPAWDRAHVSEEGIPNSIRKAMKAADIIFEETLNEKPGFFTWAKYGARMALKNTRGKPGRLMTKHYRSSTFSNNET